MHPGVCSGVLCVRGATLGKGIDNDASRMHPDKALLYIGGATGHGGDSSLESDRTAMQRRRCLRRYGRAHTPQRAARVPPTIARVLPSPCGKYGVVLQLHTGLINHAFVQYDTVNRFDMFGVHSTRRALPRFQSTNIPIVPMSCIQY